MPVTTTTGDIFTTTHQTLTIPVNCVGVPGAGLAKQMASFYPNTTSVYRTLCRQKMITPANPWLHYRLKGSTPPTPPNILLFATKLHYSNRSNMTDISMGLLTVAINIQQGIWDVESLALPALGCGLGGLEFAHLQEEVELRLGHLDIPIDLYHPH